MEDNLITNPSQDFLRVSSAIYTVKNIFWENNDHPHPADIAGCQYPDWADFLTDNAIIKSRKGYIVGHFSPHPSRAGFLYAR